MPQEQYKTDMYEGMLAETVTVKGHGGKLISAYFARPLGPGPYPGMVIIHHAPGWDEWTKETTRKFAYHGYLAICPNIYFDAGHGSPEDVAAKVRSSGGVPDDDVVEDAKGCIALLRSLPENNGKVGIFGTCSGGRHSFLVACRVSKGSLDALVDCWGGRVVMKKEELSPKTPVAPIDYTKDLSCPMIGLFGNDDQNPAPDQVNKIEEELRKQGKNYEFHRYPGAGHGFFYYNRPELFRAEQTLDGWKKIFAFLEKYLD
jgi:carboxymethylenebutenolidase